MSTSKRPAAVLVHGAWHTPRHYGRFIDQLQSKGFEVFCPHLPTCNALYSSHASLSTDVETVKNIIRPLVDQSRDVLMLLHSYGGAVGTQAVKGLSRSERETRGKTGGVIRLIYMCAFMLQIDQSVGEASLPRPVPDPVRNDPITGTTSICESPIELFYADLDPKLAREMEGLLVHQSARALTDAITYPAWQHIPTTYLKTTEDAILFPDWQDRQIKAVQDSGAAIEVETFKASHSPFLSMPNEVIAAIERAIE